MINKLYPLVSCLVLFCFTSNGQEYEGKSARDIYDGANMISYANPTKAPSLIMFEEGAITEQNFFSEMRTSFHMKFADSWKKVRTDKDELQMQHHRYQQYYNGIAVEQGEYILHEKNNFLVSANGVFFDGLNIPVSPVFTESDALKAALADVRAKRYKWEMPNEEKLLKENN